MKSRYVEVMLLVGIVIQEIFEIKLTFLIGGVGRFSRRMLSWVWPYIHYTLHKVDNMKHAECVS